MYNIYDKILIVVSRWNIARHLLTNSFKFSVYFQISEKSPGSLGFLGRELVIPLCLWFACRLSENSRYCSVGPLCLFGSFSSQALPSLGQPASASTWSVVASLDPASGVTVITVPSIFSNCLWVFSNCSLWSGFPVAFVTCCISLTMKFIIELMWEKHKHHAPPPM